MANVLSPLMKQRFVDNNGNALANGLLTSYAAGTTTPIATYNATGATNANPIVLNARGECDIWVLPNVAYKFLLTDSLLNTIPGWPIDNVVNSQLLTLYGGVDTGVANAYAITFTANFTGLSNGIVIYWVPANGNSGASTINVNSLGAVALVNPDGSALTSGQITAGQPIQMMYYSGNWILLNGSFVTGSLKVGSNLTVSGTATINGNLTTSGTLTASTSSDNVGKGIPIVRFKAITTGRSSNTTISLDPDLQLTIAGGSWQFEALLLFNGTTTGTQGISLSLKAGGSGPASVNPYGVAQGFVNGAASQVSANAWIIGTAPGWSYSNIVTANNDAAFVSGTLIGATAGTYGIGWSQATTSVNATNMLAGSWMRMVRMA